MAQRGKKPIPKTQREISISQQEPYVNPDTGETRGNPNDSANLNNRGKQTSFRNDDVKPFELGFKEIDESIFYYMENVIKPKIDQNGVIQKVPIIYGSPERWKQIQKDGYYRDKKGKIMMPLITFKRVNIEKNRTLTNKLDANNPNNLHVFEKKYSPKNTYDNFNILNNRIPKKQFYAIVVPDYVTITYDFIISTYYVEQLNKLIESMSYASDSYWGNPERFKFKAMIDSFATPIELNPGGERIVKSTFQLKLHGYLVPNTIQKQLNSIKKYSNKNSIIFTTEVVNTLDDIQIRDTQDRTEINVSDEFPIYAQTQITPTPSPTVDEFIIKINTALGDGLSEFKFTPVVSGTGDFDVDWGDGNVDTNISLQTDSRLDHSYSSAGIYEIKITSRTNLSHYNLTASPDVLKWIDVVNWGINSTLTNFSNLFYGANSLTSISATDVPDLSNVTNFNGMLRGSAINYDFSSWDFTNGTTFTFFALSATAINSSIGGNNFSNMTLGQSFYQGVTTNTSSLANLTLGGNVSYFFYNTSNFSFNTLTNVDFSNVTDATGFFDNSGLTDTDYRNFLTDLTGWNGTTAIKTLQSNVKMDFDNAKFEFGGQSEDIKNYLLNTKGWTISDGGGI